MPVVSDLRDQVMTLELINPGRKNALSTEMFSQLEVALTTAARDDAIRVVVLTGAGCDFCSGADLSETTVGRSHWLPYMRWVAQICARLHELPKPAIAKVRGAAVGAGASLALGCDLVVAAEDSIFCEIFSQRGLTPDFGGSFVLPRRVGLHRAKELAFFGRRVSGSEAANMGLINCAVPDAELDCRVDAWARELASLPPLSLGSTKRLLDASLQSSLSQALEAECQAQALNFTTRDTKEAIQAYRQKRPGNYEMR